MIDLELAPGSDAWHTARAKHDCASEAAAMLGMSPHMKRNELLRMKKTGSVKEFSAFVQERVLDKGHEVEAAARPIVEASLGDELYPVVGMLEVEGLHLLASFDGLTMDGGTVWECKLWNTNLARAVDRGELPEAYWPQLEHQLLVSGAERAVFTVSDGTGENTIVLEYKSDPERRKALIAGWKQFHADLEAYVPVEVIPAATGTPVKQLPAIIYKLDGLALSSNLPEFRMAAERLVDDSKKPLETDQDFADREAMNKAFKEAEAKIDLIKGQVVGEINDVDAFCRGLSDVGALIRQARLNGEKQVQARKDAIRVEIQDKAKAAFAAHIATLNHRLGKSYMPAVPADFGAVMKGKKTIASLKDAVDTEMARAKIDANAIADRIQINLNTLRELAADHAFLFADTAQIVLKEPEDLTTLVKMRIGEHKAEQERKEAAERERIRAEEKAKLEKEEADRKAKEEAERARKENEERARLQAEERARAEAETKARADEQARAATASLPAAAAPAPAPVHAASAKAAPFTRERTTKDAFTEINDAMVGMNLAELDQVLAAVNSILAARPQLKTA